MMYDLYGNLMQIEELRAREYHFRNVHVYVNALFENREHLKAVYEFKPIKIYLKENHRVHIFFWNVNTDDETMQRMIKFIVEASNITCRPVYVHIPKMKYFGMRRTEMVYMMLRAQIENKEDKIYGILPRVRIVPEDIAPVTFYHSQVFGQVNSGYSFKDRYLKVGFSPMGEYAYPLFIKTNMGTKKIVEATESNPFNEVNRLIKDIIPFRILGDK